MRIDVITIFPEYLAPLRASLLGRAVTDGVIELAVHDLRDWTTDRHRTVDDSPYGGGPGMVMRPDVWGLALDEIAGPTTTLVVPTPAGEPFTQRVAADLSGAGHLVFACGRYEGIDQRVVDEARGRMTVREISIGDYVLAGGEAAVLVMVEAVARLLPGVLGNPESAGDDSFGVAWPGLVEAPSYTRPPPIGAMTCPPCCSRATMRRSAVGGGRRHCSAPRRTGRIWWRRSTPPIATPPTWTPCWRSGRRYRTGWRSGSSRSARSPRPDGPRRRRGTDCRLVRSSRQARSARIDGRPRLAQWTGCRAWPARAGRQPPSTTEHD